MSKEVLIGMLKVANNGKDLLTILDSSTNTEEEAISSDAVSFSGEPVNFWIWTKGGKKPPFLCHIDKDYPFFI